MSKTTGARMDSHRVRLRTGEGQRKDGSYCFRWTDSSGQRRSLYAPTLQELRMKEDEVLREKVEGLRTDGRYLTVNDLFARWKELKRGLRDSTMNNYVYMYENYVAPNFGRTRLNLLKKSDVRAFYIRLVEQSGLQVSTLDNIHTVLHQVLELGVDDEYLRRNPSSNALREIKLAYGPNRRSPGALTLEQQERLLEFVRGHEEYDHWFPLFAVMLGTGLRVGEATGLRWCDLDFEQGRIHVDHTLIYNSHTVDEGAPLFTIHPPKTAAGRRTVPMTAAVRAALQEQRAYLMREGVRCRRIVDGYTDFVFLNRFGDLLHYGTINKAIVRVVRDCNIDALDRFGPDAVLLPHFSSHAFRHTFATRMIEAGVSAKVVQDVLGHTRISTTLDIYTDVTERMQKQGFETLEQWFREQEDSGTG